MSALHKCHFFHVKGNSKRQHVDCWLRNPGKVVGGLDLGQTCILFKTVCIMILLVAFCLRKLDVIALYLQRLK